MPVDFVKDGNGFRSEWEKLTTFKLVIACGGIFWMIFTLSFGIYNYCAIKKPTPPVSFDEALCAEEEALLSTNKSIKEPSTKTLKSSMSSKR